MPFPGIHGSVAISRCSRELIASRALPYGCRPTPVRPTMNAVDALRQPAIDADNGKNTSMHGCITAARDRCRQREKHVDAWMHVRQPVSSSGTRRGMARLPIGLRELPVHNDFPTASSTADGRKSRKSYQFAPRLKAECLKISTCNQVEFQAHHLYFQMQRRAKRCIHKDGPDEAL